MGTTDICRLGLGPLHDCTTEFKINVKANCFFVEGAIMLSAGRPVDCLRQLLIECGGPEAEAVRGYFGLQVRFFSLQTKVF